MANAATTITAMFVAMAIIMINIMAARQTVHAFESLQWRGYSRSIGKRRISVNMPVMSP